MLSDLTIIPPKKGAFTIETDEHFTKQHTLCCWSGKRGSGKSVACANQIRIAKKRGYYDRVWLITGTFESNKEIWQGIADIQSSDVLLPTKFAFKEVIEKLEEEKKKWDVYKNQLRSYNEFNKEKGQGPVDFLNRLTERETLDLSKPKWPYKRAVPPRCCVVCDDCMGEDLFLPSGKLTRYVIAHRHFAGGLGISVHMLLQSYCSRESLPRPVREQLTVLCLFAMSQIEQIKKCWAEADLPGMSFEAFLHMFRHATEQQHSFLMIDFSPKNEYQRYRINMDTYLDPTPFILEYPMKE